MRISPRLIALILLILGTTVSGQTVIENRSTDTLWIDSISTHSGQKATLDIYFSNTDTINAVDIPLSYKYPDLIIDSVSFIGSRLENRFVTVVNIDTAGATCHIGGFYFDIENEEVGPGSGLLARIHMTIPDEYPSRLIPFDTTRIQTSLTFVSEDDISYIPIFIMGYVDNTYAPNLADSVWVEDVDIIPGESFGVTVYSFNEHPIYSIKMPLEYESDNIVFDSISTSGTRSFNAVVADALPDDVLKKVLVSIRFSDDQLLPTGDGPIAILHFSCLMMGTSATVSLDTTEMEGFEYYFKLGSLFSNVKVYPDFNPGTISIDLATDAGHDVLSNLPTAYDLSQNYPNPFNPTTAIAFALPERSHVVLEVFNVLGQRVRHLIDETMPAGNHSIVFDGLDNDGRELASGIYLYRIKTEGFSQSKKMMLMK